LQRADGLGSNTCRSLRNAEALISGRTMWLFLSYLDGKVTAFGKVVDGMNAVRAIEKLPTDGDRPFARINLTRVRIERIPD
jgi:hypothetical protein